MKGARILVTGGAGFIGSHIVDACERRGDIVFSIDDMSSGKRENLNPSIGNYEVDISDFSALEKVFKKLRPDIIFHCAALARIQPSFSDPDRYFQVNVVGTRNVLLLARKFGARKIVYSASSSAYGDRETPALHEEMQLTPQALHPYASTKRMGEMLMRDMGDYTGGPETVCLRYFNVYGPRQNTILDGPYPTVIGIFLDQWRRGEPLTIVPDGYQRRDFTWVGDIARANLLAAFSFIKGGEVINIGTGKNYSVWEAARLILGLVKDVPPGELLRAGMCAMASPRKGEVRATLADISKARILLGWEPKFTFEKGIEALKNS